MIKQDLGLPYAYTWADADTGKIHLELIEPADYVNAIGLKALYTEDQINIYFSFTLNGKKK